MYIITVLGQLHAECNILSYKNTNELDVTNIRSPIYLTDNNIPDVMFLYDKKCCIRSTTEFNA